MFPPPERAESSFIEGRKEEKLSATERKSRRDKGIELALKSKGKKTDTLESL